MVLLRLTLMSLVVLTGSVQVAKCLLAGPNQGALPWLRA